MTRAACGLPCAQVFRWLRRRRAGGEWLAFFTLHGLLLLAEDAGAGALRAAAEHRHPAAAAALRAPGWLRWLLTLAVLEMSAQALWTVDYTERPCAPLAVRPRGAPQILCS
jgi:hypothetical protein